MSSYNLKCYCFACLLFASFGAALLCGCAGITSQAERQPSPTPTPAPAATADHVLLQTGERGTVYKEFAVTDSGLQQVGNDITLPTAARSSVPILATVHGFLFALDSGPVAAIDTFAADPVAGTFSPSGQTALQPGAGVFSTDPSGTYLYVNESHDDPLTGPATGYESNLNAFHIGADGGLTQVPGAPFIFAGGPGTGGDCCFALDSRLAFTPDGTKAYAVTLSGCACHGGVPGFWTVQPFVRDANTGAITRNTSQAGLPPTSEFLVGGVVVVRNGRYAVFPTIDGVMVYSIDASTGSLARVDAPSPVPPTDAHHPYVDIAATADGEFIYLDQPSSSLIFGLHVEADGSLTPVPGSPYNAGNMGHLTLSSTDRFLFVQDFAQGLVAFKRNPNTGALVQFSAAPVPPVWTILSLN
jgi:lactonase family protein with 7-bladed beta-propeller